MAVESSKKADYISGLARAFSNMAIVYKNTGRYNLSIQYLDSSTWYSIKFMIVPDWPAYITPGYGVLLPLFL